MYDSLKGRSVLVTGASRGIGRAIAEAFAAHGCNLHIVARDIDRLCVVAQKIADTSGVRVVPHARDLATAEGVHAVAAACAEADVLVNNAGGIPFGALQEIDGVAWRAAWDLKVFGYIDLTRELLIPMSSRGRGVVVNVIGAAALRPNPKYIAGCTANAALDMFTRCLGAESIKHGVRVVAVHPGPIVSDRLEEELRRRASTELGSGERWRELLQSMSPAGHPGMPEDVARTVVFLASDEASYISGAALRVDAGRI